MIGVGRELDQSRANGYGQRANLGDTFPLPSFLRSETLLQSEISLIFDLFLRG